MPYVGCWQVWLADNTASGVIIVLGIALCSPITAVAAVTGSLIGTATGV